MGKNHVDFSVAQGELDIAHRFDLMKEGDPSRLWRFHQEIDIPSPFSSSTRDPKRNMRRTELEPTLDRAFYYGDFRFGQSHGLACLSRRTLEPKIRAAISAGNDPRSTSRSFSKVLPE